METFLRLSARGISTGWWDMAVLDDNSVPSLFIREKESFRTMSEAPEARGCATLRAWRGPVLALPGSDCARSVAHLVHGRA